MVIPDTFGTRGEKKIASYDYYDIAEGTGIKIFSGCATTDSGGEDHILTSQTLYANPILVKSDQFTVTSFTKEKTINFDLSAFNLPKTIKGTALIDGSFAIKMESNHTGHCYIVFTIYHYDGSTETSIGTVTTETITQTSSVLANSFCLQVALSQKHFKKGDILRAKAEIWGKYENNDTVYGYLACDPKNRNGIDGATTIFTAANNHTTLNFHIPFRLDL